MKVRLQEHYILLHTQSPFHLNCRTNTDPILISVRKSIITSLYLICCGSHLCVRRYVSICKLKVAETRNYLNLLNIYIFRHFRSTAARHRWPRGEGVQHLDCVRHAGSPFTSDSLDHLPTCLGSYMR